MSTPLTLDTTHADDGKLVVCAAGEIDQTNIDLFSQALATAAARSAASGGPITVDLSAVEYLDSAAINVLYANAEHIEVIAHPRLTRILTVSGVSELVSIRASG
jgi:anti-anti-sigma factor